MGTCNKKDGTEVTVLRNSTTLVMHMKVYDESIQQGQRGVPRGWAVLSPSVVPPSLTAGPSFALALVPSLCWLVQGTHTSYGCCPGCPSLAGCTLAPRSPSPPFLCHSWDQPLQPEQRGLLAAVPPHLGDLPLLHVHRRLQPQERAAVL